MKSIIDLAKILFRLNAKCDKIRTRSTKPQDSFSDTKQAFFHEQQYDDCKWLSKRPKNWIVPRNRALNAESWSDWLDKKSYLLYIQGDFEIKNIDQLLMREPRRKRFMLFCFTEVVVLCVKIRCRKMVWNSFSSASCEPRSISSSTLLCKSTSVRVWKVTDSNFVSAIAKCIRWRKSRYMTECHKSCVEAVWQRISSFLL